MTATPDGAAAPPFEKRLVREMFSAIAPTYDLLNHLLSLNFDRSWRRAAVARLLAERQPEGRYLDACAGTLDLAAALVARPEFRGTVTGADFAVPMLKLGAGKAAGGVRCVAADVLRLPFEDRTFEGAMVGFGLRNLSDMDAGLAEMRRVLKDGARLVVLDFSTPPAAPLRAPYLAYFRRVLPLLGRLVSGHATAYSYLPSSVTEFPPPPSLAARLERAGFRGCGWQPLSGGIAAVHWGERRP